VAKRLKQQINIHWFYCPYTYFDYVEMRFSVQAHKYHFIQLTGSSCFSIYNKKSQWSVFILSYEMHHWDFYYEEIAFLFITAKYCLPIKQLHESVSKACFME